MTTGRPLLLNINPVNSDNARRESLTSFFSAIAARNQLAVSSILGKLFLPRSAKYGHLGKCQFPAHLSNFGGSTTQEVSSILYSLCGAKNLERLSFYSWNTGNQMRPLILVEKFRKWCPECYCDAVAEERRLYEQLIWSASGVEVCPVHNCFLSRICPGCRRGGMLLTFSNSISGFCPYCFCWLGGPGSLIGSNEGESAKFLFWIANAVAELLSTTPSASSNPHSNLAFMLRRLVEIHFDGNISEAAIHLRKRKSDLSGWRSGATIPRWKTILDISFGFQTSVRDLYLRDEDALTFSQLRAIPIDPSKKRRGFRVLKTYDWALIEKFLNELEKGHHPEILQLVQVAKKFGVDRTVLKRGLPTDVEKLRIMLKKRRMAVAEQIKSDRRVILERRTREAVSLLRKNGMAITRRAIVNYLHQAGIKLLRAEFLTILDLALLQDQILGTSTNTI
jgi:hypothetical protein